LRIDFIVAGLAACEHALCLRSIQENQDGLLRGGELILDKVYDMDQEKPLFCRRIFIYGAIFQPGGDNWCSLSM